MGGISSGNNSLLILDYIILGHLLQFLLVCVDNDKGAEEQYHDDSEDEIPPSLCRVVVLLLDLRVAE